MISPSQHLLIFTRYPMPGTTKTRLIPALGAEGAAALQRELTDYTLQQALSLDLAVSLVITMYFQGGTEEDMRQWLGDQLNYVPQRQGDLGQRMLLAVAEAFNQSAQRVIIIGSDCPGLNTKILEQGFDALQTHDVVLGPALDGGYYLLGMRSFMPSLFAGIAWGSSQVYAQTRALIDQAGSSCALLPPLADLDRPEDLVHFPFPRN